MSEKRNRSVERRYTYELTDKAWTKADVFLKKVNAPKMVVITLKIVETLKFCRKTV